MMMYACLGSSMDGDGPGPKLLRTRTGKINRNFAVHAKGLCGIAVKLTGWHDAHAIVLPECRATPGLLRGSSRKAVDR